MKTVTYLAFAFLIGNSDGAFAQTAVLSSDSFDYFPCSQMMKQDEIDGFFFGIESAVDIYNSQDGVDVKMAPPRKDQCYVSVGRSGTMFGGVPFVSFYTSYPHLECSVRGDCIGDLAGYQADVAFMQNSAQFTANTNRVEDLVVLCFEGGKMTPGSCE